MTAKQEQQRDADARYILGIPAAEVLADPQKAREALLLVRCNVMKGSEHSPPSLTLWEERTYAQETGGWCVEYKSCAATGKVRGVGATLTEATVDAIAKALAKMHGKISSTPSGLSLWKTE